MSTMSTKERILFALKEQQGQFVSGEVLAEQYSLSRTGIWKHICKLKDEGYEIESASRLGYVLRSSPDLMLPAEILYGLRTKKLGRRILYFSEIDSTNNRAKELALAGAPEGTLVIAEEQRTGRGRLARNWVSPRGGIWFSIILRPPMTPVDLLKMTILAGAAGAESIKEVTGLNPGVKWPNDIVINGKKVAGILTEMETEADTVHFVVLGIGINANIGCNAFPPDIEDKATSLSELLGRNIDRSQLLRALLQKLEEGYRQLESGNFSKTRDFWKRHSCTLGRRVEVETAGGLIAGTAVDVNDQGALIVQPDRGANEIVWSGDLLVLE